MGWSLEVLNQNLPKHGNVSGSKNGPWHSQRDLRTLASRRLPHVDIKCSFPPQWLLKSAEMYVACAFLSKVKFLRSIRTDYWKPDICLANVRVKFADTNQTTIANLYNLKILFMKDVLFWVLILPIPFITDRWRTVTNVRRSFRDMFLTIVVARYCTILFMFDFFAGFTFKACNVQLLPDGMVVEGYESVGLHPLEHLVLGAPSPRMVVKPTVLAKRWKEREGISEHPRLLLLLWCHETISCFWQLPSTV